MNVTKCIVPYAWPVHSLRKVAALALTGMLLSGCRDLTAPDVPVQLTASATGCTQVALSWSASADLGGSGLQGYRLYRNNAFVQQVAAPAVTATDSVAAATRYTYAVSAIDGAGNESVPSEAAVVATPACGDSAAPTSGAQFTEDLNRPNRRIRRPTGVAATATTCNDVALSWNPSTVTGESGVEGYEIDRDGTFLKEVLAPATGTSDAGLTASTAYAYTVRALDNAGNRSAATRPVSVSTPACAANEPPVANAGPDQATQTLISISLDGSRSYDPDDTIQAYAWTFGDGGSASTKSAMHSYATAGTYTAMLTVTDSAGAARSDTATITVSSREPPTGGSRLWSRRFGGTTFVDTVTVRGIATAPNGDVVVAGYFAGTVNFGGGNLTSAGGIDIFVAEYSAANGAHVWSRRYGSAGNDFAAAVAVDATRNDGTGDVVVAGGFDRSIDFGGGAFESAGGYDVFVARLSSSGSHRWSESFGGPDDDSAAGLAITTSGDVSVTGTFNGSIDLGGGVLTSAGNSDVFVAQYTGMNGAHLWSRRGGGSGADKSFGIAVEGTARVTVIGTFAGSASFGGSNLSSAGGLDVFVAQYAGATDAHPGAHQWSKRFGGRGNDYGTGIAVSPSGNVVVAGQFDSAIDFGGGTLSNSGGPDIFVALLSSADGAHVWSRGYGNLSNFQEVATGVAVDASGNVLLAGNLIDAVDFGGDPLPASGGYDPILVKISASGNHLWSRRFGGPQYAYNYSAGVAVDASSNVVTAGSFSGTIDMAGSSLDNADDLVNQSYDGFMVKFAP